MMLRFFAVLAVLSTPAFAQAPPRQSVADLQAAWNVRAYGEAQAVKALDVILKELEAVTKERDELKAVLEKANKEKAPE